MAFVQQIFLETTNKCCANCKTCLNRVMKRERGVMDFELFKKLVDDIVQERKAGMVHLYGVGEPYLTPGYLNYCNYAIPKLNSAGIVSVIISNGMLITDIPMGLTTINISFNAGKKETFEKITGLDYDRTLKNIYRLANEGQFNNVQNKEIHMLVFEDNKDEIEDFKKTFEPLKEYGIKLRLGFKYDNQLGLIEDKTIKDYKTKQRFACHYIKNVLNICWDGIVVPCPHDFDGELSYGDANKQTINELLIHPQRKELLVKHLKGIYDNICTNCNFNISFEGKYVYV